MAKYYNLLNKEQFSNIFNYRKIEIKLIFIRTYMFLLSLANNFKKNKEFRKLHC